MKKFTQVLSKVLIGICGVAIACVLFKVYFIGTVFTPEEGYYDISTEEGVRTYLHVDGDSLEMIYSDEYNTIFGKATYKTSWQVWNHMWRDLYFREDSLLSAKLAPEECQPVTVTMKCTHNYYCDTFSNDGFDVLSYDDAVGTVVNMEIFFFDDYIITNGVTAEKMDSLEDPVLEEMIRLFIEPAFDNEG